MREKIIELLGEDVCIHDCCGDCECQGNEDMCIATLKAYMADHLIANDVVLVVRCKDCKHIRTASWGEKYCVRKQIDGTHAELSNLREDDFCSYGERKDNA